MKDERGRAFIFFSGGKLRILGEFGDRSMAVLDKYIKVHSKTKNECHSNRANVKIDPAKVF